MKLLLDANLSFRLVRKLEAVFSDCLHVERTGLPIPAGDFEIWSWAKAHDYLIVTNDDDFHRLASRHGFPPKVVLLRTGNQSTRAIAEILIRHKTDIEQLYSSDEYGLLELL